MTFRRERSVSCGKPIKSIDKKLNSANSNHAQVARQASFLTVGSVTPKASMTAAAPGSPEDAIAITGVKARMRAATFITAQ